MFPQLSHTFHFYKRFNSKFSNLSTFQLSQIFSTFTTLFNFLELFNFPKPFHFSFSTFCGNSMNTHTRMLHLISQEFIFMHEINFFCRKSTFPIPFQLFQLFRSRLGADPAVVTCRSLLVS